MKRFERADRRCCKHLGSGVWLGSTPEINFWVLSRTAKFDSYFEQLERTDRWCQRIFGPGARPNAAFWGCMGVYKPYLALTCYCAICTLCCYFIPNRMSLEKFPPCNTFPGAGVAQWIAQKFIISRKWQCFPANQIFAKIQNPSTTFGVMLHIHTDTTSKLLGPGIIKHSHFPKHSVGLRCRFAWPDNHNC